MVEVLKQGKHVPLPFERQVAIIFAATSGILDDANKTKIAELETAFFGILENQFASTLGAMRESHDLSDASQAQIKEAITALRLAHPDLFLK